jgi:hypothetical protein
MYKCIWLRGKIKKAFLTMAERKALRYSQGIGLSNASGRASSYLGEEEYNVMRPFQSTDVVEICKTW